jgi:hypothetical protein
MQAELDYTINSDIERTSFTFVLGHSKVMKQLSVKTSLKKEEDKVSSPVLVDSTSDESESSEGEVDKQGSCSKLRKLVKVNGDNFKFFDFEAKVGLNAAHMHSYFPCLLEETRKRFFVWLGDVTIDKFNKSTFLNLVNFAESNGAENMVLIQSRDHC